jgi:DNA end-binding protein Ku
VPEEDLDQGSGGARPFWSGTITFGLVSVPVALMPAQRSVGTSLRMVSPEGTPLERRYFSTGDERPLTRDDIVRGFAIEKDRYVVIDDDELEKIAPERTRDIDLRLFVKASDIDPIYFEKAYYLTPAGDSTKAYRLLARVMEESDRAGIATFVMRGKEYLVAILAENGILRAETLRFAEEVRTPEFIGLPDPVELKLTDIRKYEKEISKLAKPSLDPKELVDKSDDRLLKLVKEKVKAGKDVFELEEEDSGDSGDVLDLVALLQRSLSGGAEAAMKQESGKKASSTRTTSGKATKSTSSRNGRSAEAPPPKKNAGSVAKKSRSSKAASSKGASGRDGAGRNRTSGKKNGKSDDLAEATRTELYDKARELEIPGRSEMSREELLTAIRAAG